MDTYYKDFVRKSANLGLMINISFHLLIFFIFSSIARSSGSYQIFFLMFLTFPLGYSVLFMFFLKAPEIKIVRSRKNIDAELISAIRFMILDLKANAPLFESMRNISKNFDEIGVYLKDVIIKVNLGSSLEHALDEAVELVPSESFRVFVWQLINHLQTGSDITGPLHTIAEEFVEKQRIEFKRYGKKLNVLSLFYMIIAIILPTIGFNLVSAALIFIGVQINIGIILGFWVLFSVLQLLFLALSGGNRPVVES